VPGGALIQRLFVGRDVERIFGYRRRVLDELFGHDRVEDQHVAELQIDAAESRHPGP
jgi:hypothetical protein